MIEKSKLTSSFNQSYTRFPTNTCLTYSDNEDRKNAIQCHRTDNITQTSAIHCQRNSQGPQANTSAHNKKCSADIIKN